MLAAVEAGGTKMICAVARDPATILHQTSIPTTAPGETIAAMVAFFRAAGEGKVQAIGIGCFGPLDLEPTSPGFGAITRTPKLGWSGVNLRRALSEAVRCPAVIDTDVAASGIAEAAFGAGQGLRSMAYVTVGTGIGGALIRDGQPLCGLTHPEMGHIRPRRHPQDRFAGVCPFHGDCLEGLASGAAVFARRGQMLSEINPDDVLWEVLSDYLGQFCATLVLMASPQRIVIGGGVPDSNPGLFALVRRSTRASLGEYVQAAVLSDAIDSYIVPPALGAHAGLVGALMLAQRAQAHEGSSQRSR
jgi:fructokinase